MNTVKLSNRLVSPTTYAIRFSIIYLLIYYYIIKWAAKRGHLRQPQKIIQKSQLPLPHLIFQIRRTNTSICFKKSTSNFWKADNSKISSDWFRNRAHTAVVASHGALVIRLLVERRLVGRSQVRRGRRGRRHSKREKPRARSMKPRNKTLGLKRRSESPSTVSLQTCSPMNGWRISWNNLKETSNLQVSYSLVSTGQRSFINSFLLMKSNRLPALRILKDFKCVNIDLQSSIWTVESVKCVWNLRLMDWLWENRHS